MAKKKVRRDFSMNLLKNTNLTNVKPITDNQIEAFDSWDQGLNLVLHGVAGTGKTFIAMYFAFQAITNERSDQSKIFIIRSTVPSRNQGFMPGKAHEKEAPFEDPYPPICTELWGRGDAYSILKQKQDIEFRSTSWLRGVTFDNCVLVVDEFQNMDAQELHTIMTRIGLNCRIIFCGDVKQDDLTSERYKEKSGIHDFMKITKSMESFDFIEFGIDDIVRSDIVKEYIIARNKLGL